MYLYIHHRQIYAVKQYIDKKFQLVKMFDDVFCQRVTLKGKHLEQSNTNKVEYILKRNNSKQLEYILQLILNLI